MSFSPFSTNFDNAVLISLILETIFFCAYTVLCGYTIWHLKLRKSRHTYMSCLIILWLLTISTLPLDWYRYQTTFPKFQATTLYIIPNNGDSVFETSILIEIDNILSVLVMMIADALLIYRCYIVCGGKRWILMTFGTFILADIVGACIEFIPFVSRGAEPGGLRYRPYNLSYFIMGLFISSIVINGVGTSLIILRILSATRKNPCIGNPASYRRIRRILVESGAIYLLSLVTTGAPLTLACCILNPPRSPGPLWIPSFVICSTILTYSQALLTPLSGIAPTLIALRVVTQKPRLEADGTQPVSRLTFRRTVRRQHTTAFGSLVSSLHFESTWEDKDIASGTSGVVENVEAGNVEGSNPESGEQIRSQEV